MFWSAPAERNCDGAFARLQTAGKLLTFRACAESKAAWRFASRRTPKMSAACSKSWHNSAVGWQCA